MSRPPARPETGVKSGEIMGMVMVHTYTYIYSIHTEGAFEACSLCRGNVYMKITFRLRRSPVSVPFLCTSSTPGPPSHLAHFGAPSTMALFDQYYDTYDQAGLVPEESTDLDLPVRCPRVLIVSREILI